MKYQILTIAAVSVLAATASAATTLAITSNANAASSSAATPQHVISQDDFTSAAESTVNGVVSVKSYATPRTYGSQGNNMFSDPFFDFFFGQPQQRQQTPQQEQPKQRQIGLGSGVIISKDGYIVTNNHVIADAERLEVTLNDNRNYNAKVIGADATTDLALIKIDAPDLHSIPIGDSEALKVGEWVLAVGNPFGFTSTVTSGIVSAKARNISTTTGSHATNGIESYIQTDAAVNQGNSGGALVNLKGELVGINTAIYSQTGNYVGCSFAIPSSIVSKVIDDLKQYGTVQRAYLGVRFQELTPELIEEKKIKGTTTGLYVASVEDRSAAREAGLQEGDVIIALGGNETPNTARLQESVAKFSPGDNVEVKYVRDGKTYTKKVTLRNKSGDTNVTKAESVVDLGCAFSTVSKERLDQLEISNGVAVGGLEEGRFKSAGIRDGFIIISINGKKVNSADDVENIYNTIMKGNDDKVMYIKGIYPTGKQQFYAVPLTD
jgi:Do/DeqQ family serine protease